MLLVYALPGHNFSFSNPVDVIFDFFVRGFTDLTVTEVPILFSLLDVDQSGEIEFDEFYLLFCILIACKVSNL